MSTKLKQRGRGATEHWADGLENLMDGSQARSFWHRCISIAVCSNPRAFLRSQTGKKFKTLWSIISWVMNEVRAHTLITKVLQNSQLQTDQPQVLVRGVAQVVVWDRFFAVSWCWDLWQSAPIRGLESTPRQQKSTVWTSGPSGEFWTVCRFSPSKLSPPPHLYPSEHWPSKYREKPNEVLMTQPQ